MSGIIDFFYNYWYILVAVVGISIIIIWVKADAYTRSKISKIFSGKTLVVIFFILGWFLWFKYGGRTELSNANRWMPVLGALILAGYNYIGLLRYETQQFVALNFHGSFAKNPYHVNGFYVFPIGTFNSGGLSWDYAKEIVVVREETVELLNRGAVCLAELGFVSKYELPEDVMAFIESNKFLQRAQNSVYYGWFDSIEREDYNFKQLKKLAEEKKDPNHIYNLLKKELGVDNPKVSTLYWLYRNQSKAVNKQTQYYDSTVESVEKGVEHHRRVRDAYVDKRDEQPEKTEGNEEY